MDILFPFSEYWNFYLYFSLFIIALLVVDLGVFHRDDHEISMREALGWTVVWIGLALVFNVIFYFYALGKFTSLPRFTGAPGFDAEATAWRVSLEFLTGFVVEKSLAVDNLFVFVAIFAFLGIPAKYQHRVLFFGIIGALLFRAAFIAIGSYLMAYKAVVIVFGILLMLTGVKIFFAPEKQSDLSESKLLRLVQRILPVTPRFDGHNFFTKENGKWLCTPLFVALVAVEFCDIVFAFDSVPAIFSLTSEPLIVFTSNVFAILGLRSLYFLLARAYHRFHLLKYGLGTILVFVGLKMVWLNEAFGGKFPVGMSLGFIAGILALSMGASLWTSRKQVAVT